MHFLLLIVTKERGGPPTNGIGGKKKGRERGSNVIFLFEYLLDLKRNGMCIYLLYLGRDNQI